jgi:hypothetical protein
MRFFLRKLVDSLGIGLGSSPRVFMHKILNLFDFPLIARNLALKIISNENMIVSQRIYFDEVYSLYSNFVPTNNGHSLVRIGGPNDGGYLVPNDLQGVNYCFSPGSGNIWRFENELASRFAIESFMIDGTIAPPLNLSPMQHFKNLNLSPTTNNSAISLFDWVESSVPKEDSNLLLQMDIEGSEYSSFLTLSEVFMNRFRIILIELHELHLVLTSSEPRRQFQHLFNSISQNHDLIHTHLNNGGGSFRIFDQDFPNVIELTFHRKDRAIEYSTQVLPSHLDERNLPGSSEFDIQSLVRWILNKGKAS